MGASFSKGLTCVRSRQNRLAPTNLQVMCLTLPFLNARIFFQLDLKLAHPEFNSDLSDEDFQEENDDDDMSLTESDKVLRGVAREHAESMLARKEQLVLLQAVVEEPYPSVDSILKLLSPMRMQVEANIGSSHLGDTCLEEIKALCRGHAKLKKLILVNQSKTLLFEHQRLTLTLREATDFFTDPTGTIHHSAYLKDFVDPDSLTPAARDDHEGVVRRNRGYLRYLAIRRYFRARDERDGTQFNQDLSQHLAELGAAKVLPGNNSFDSDDGVPADDVYEL